MKAFNGGEWFSISGRGNVYAVTLTESIWSRKLYKAVVSIEGEEYFCTGIETFGKDREHDPIKGTLYEAGEKMGLLIRGPIRS